jgi:hypothetical protein
MARWSIARAARGARPCRGHASSQRAEHVVPWLFEKTQPNRFDSASGLAFGGVGFAQLALKSAFEPPGENCE